MHGRHHHRCLDILTGAEDTVARVRRSARISSKQDVAPVEQELDGSVARHSVSPGLKLQRARGRGSGGRHKVGPTRATDRLGSDQTPVGKMADNSISASAATASTNSIVPMKRVHDEDLHAPAVSSPLNPDVASSRSRKAPATREQREKKESLKKRESKASSIVGDTRGGTPDAASNRRKQKFTPEATVLSPTRYKLPPPKPVDFDAPKPPVLNPHHTVNGVQVYETSEQ